MKYRCVCVEDSSEVNVGPMLGEASDTSDKAGNKALSAAYKYMLFQLFCIPVEGSPEDRDADYSSPQLPPPQNHDQDQKRNQEKRIKSAIYKACGEDATKSREALNTARDAAGLGNREVAEMREDHLAALKVALADQGISIGETE
jgi:hypothetical protein